MSKSDRRSGRLALTRKITAGLAVAVSLTALSATSAVAAPCDECEGGGRGGGGGARGGGGGGTTAPKFTVFVDSLLCLVTEDNSGPDEPFLLGNNVRIWGNGSLNNQESANVNASFEGQGTASIKLYDADLGSWPDYHDFLGQVVVKADQIDQGRQTGTFTEDGASYEVSYHVNSH